MTERACLSEAEFRRELVLHLPRLTKTAKALLRSSQGADDLVNDTVVNALRAAHTFQAGTNMGAWLGLICRNIFYTQSRRSWRTVPMEDGQAEAIECPADQFHALALKDVAAASSCLSTEMLEALQLNVIDGLTYDAIALAKGVPIGTIKSRVSRARSRLAERLGEEP